MADAESRSESPLSDIGSDAFSEDRSLRLRSPSNASEMSDVSEESATASSATPRTNEARPTKRRRLGDYDHPTPQSSSRLRPRSPSGSISSDSDGSVPNSPSFAHLGPTHPLSTAYAAAQANPNDPESADYTQVTTCQWADCPEPEQGNMDNLVNHINEIHIPPRQKKYFCEWKGCTRQSAIHGSAYALKAHMRSHTKEKPFMCQVPECDRSFTRSDALAKHMRTVHETEALRPSDPVPRGHSGGISAIDAKMNGTAATSLLGRKLKLTFKGNKTPLGADMISSHDPKIEGGMPALPTVTTALAAGLQNPELAQLEPEEARDPGLERAVDIDSVPFTLPVDPGYYPPEIYHDMEDYECGLPPSQWFRLLRRQIRWAQEDGRSLEKELKEMKARTDDLRGNPITRSAADDDEARDLLRKDEWVIVNNLLDRIAGAELASAMQKLDPNSVYQNGELPKAEDLGKEGIYEKVRSLPYWQKHYGHVLEAPKLDDATI